MFKLYKSKGKKIAIVDLKKEKNKNFSELTMKTIKKYNKLGKKILFLINKKGYSTGVICNDCGSIPKCKNCDIPIAHYIVWDKKKEIGMCPICKTIYDNTLVCDNCGGVNKKNYGLGIQKIKEIMKKELDMDVLDIDASTINSVNKIKKTKELMKNYNAIISTSILSQPCKEFSADLVIFLNADIWLNIPDYNSQEKVFINLYETITKQKCSNFIIQTYSPDNFLFNKIGQLDLDGFWKKELEWRKLLSYPPYGEMAIIMYKSEIEESLYNKVNKLYSELSYLNEKAGNNINIYTTPPLVYKMFGKYHYNIILKWPNLKGFLDEAQKKLKITSKHFQIDRMPYSIV